MEKKFPSFSNYSSAKFKNPIKESDEKKLESEKNES